MTTAVLVTGASSGIGRATAQRLARRPDLVVYGTTRDGSPVGDGVRDLRLDVTDEESMRAAVAHVEAEHGHVGALVNNAGYGEYGTVEEADMDRVRRQFETNVFGLARMTQLALPAMRAAGSGRVVNVGSMGGRFVFPVGGYYHASKYAVEAITDALRFEVARFGIHVSLVEPGLIRTRFDRTAAQTLAGSSAPDGPYAPLTDATQRMMANAYGSDALTATPDAVARVVERAVTSGRPRTRYVITPAAAALVHTRRLLGGRAFDALLRIQYRTA